MDRKLIYLLVFILLIPLVSSIQITEIMYNPAGSDNNKEFIEVYTDQDLTDYIIGDLNSNDTLIKLRSFPSNYSLIVEQDFNHSEINASIYSAGATIGDNLNNENDTIFLYDPSSILLTSVSYNNTFADNNGYSLELVDGRWIESSNVGGSPGLPNNQTPEIVFSNHDLEIEVYLDSTINLNQQYDKLFKITNVDSDKGIVYNISVEYNITANESILKQESFILESVNHYTAVGTGSHTFNTTGNFTICGIITNSSVNDSLTSNNIACKSVLVIDTSSIPCNVSLNISTDKQIYNLGESIKFNTNINNESFYYVIEYWIEDLFGNIRKSKYETTNTNQKSWTPDIDARDEGFLIKSRISYIACNDTYEGDDGAELLFIFKDDDYSPGTASPSSLSSSISQISDSNISIEELYQGSDNISKFGESDRVKVRIYKGNTSKYSVSLWIEDSSGTKITSETTSINLYSKYTEYLVTLPFQIKSNCDEKYDDGKYTLVLEGLDTTDTAKIQIQGISRSLCDEIEIEKKSSSKKSKSIEYSICSIPLQVKPLQNFDVAVRIENNDDEAHEFRVHGFVYRGNKQYSSDKNEKKVIVAPETTIEISLDNYVEDAEPGLYKYKARILKDDLKNYKNFVEDIEVLASEKISLIEAVDIKIQSSEQIQENDVLTKLVDFKIDESQASEVFESSSLKALKLVPYLFVMVCALIVTMLLWRT